MATSFGSIPCGRPALPTIMNPNNLLAMNATIAAEIRRLTPVEKLQLVADLWDEIAASADMLPIPDWHRNALAEDEAQYRTNPTDGAPWAEVKARLLKRL
jgi:putative addiction module component (TIGR02574 family)